jgi:DNA-directed RNA polymerase subunit A'
MQNLYIDKKIKKIVFGILSPKLIKKMAAVKIVTAELYDKEGYPVDGGLMDVSLGVIDPGLRCKTCNGKLKGCAGHFGYVELARPIIHIKYTKKIFILLNSICRECGRLLATEQEIQEKGLKGNLLLKYLKGIKKCPHCEAKQFTIKLEKPYTFLEDDKRITSIDIISRFEKMPDQDAQVIGINPQYARPEWMILTVLPIPPVTTRPSITLETGERSEDDLTHKLGDIVRINQRLFENINAGAPEIIIEDLWDLLQYHITTYFDNEIPQIPPARHRSGQPLKTLTERIKSKEGRFRHNLAGKRVNFASRTVISPDPKIEFNEVGVPYVVALELTIPETVSEWNINWLKKFIENGPEKYPGANYVILPDGKKKKITEDTKKQIIEDLKLGYVVERHLMDGDICVFNRQPSLHRMSIMCHKVKVMPGK